MSIYNCDFHESTAIPSHPGARLLYMSQESYTDEWQNVQHTHNCSEFFYILEGKGTFYIENKKHPVCSNDLVIVNPNILHTEASQKDSPMKYIVLGIEGLELSFGKDEDVRNYCIVNFKNIRSQVLFFLQSMLTEFTEKPAGYDSMCQHYMDILILLLNRQLNFAPAPSSINKKTTRLCDLVRRYIDTHYWEPITLDLLSDISHFSKYHLVHTFTAEYGISPIQYLIDKRMEEGEKLLRTTDYSLAQISRFCGFSSPSYFSQIFKKEKKCSPSQFRRNNKNK